MDKFKTKHNNNTLNNDKKLILANTSTSQTDLKTISFNQVKRIIKQANSHKSNI